MEYASRKRAVLAAHAGMQQPHNDIRIFLAPTTKVGVKAINAIEIRPPNGEVARPRALPDPLTESPQGSEWQVQQRRQAIDTAAPALGEPAPETPSLRGDVFSQYPRREFPRKQNAVAGDKPARLGQSAMSGNKIRAHDAITVQKNAINAACG